MLYAFERASERTSERYKCSVDVRAQTALNHFDATYVVRTPDRCAAAYIAQESRKGLSACISVARLIHDDMLSCEYTDECVCLSYIRCRPYTEVRFRSFSL